MKKKKILLINIIILFFVFVLMEIISYNVLLNKYREDIIHFNNILNIKTDNSFFPLIKYNKVILPDRENLLQGFRPTEYRNKKPIILFGCSYTWGFGLNEDETFSRQLADYTDRTVINRGISGTGMPFLYYQLSDEQVLKELPKDSEFIIYTLIPDHFPRLFRYRIWVLTGAHTLRYKISDNELKEDKLIFPMLHSLYTAIVLEEYLADKNSGDERKRRDLSYMLFKNSYKIIKDNFKNAKFVILYFEEQYNAVNPFAEEIENIKSIDNDIIFVDINELIPEINNKEYWLEDNTHPNAKAWELIIPKLTEKIGL